MKRTPEEKKVLYEQIQRESLICRDESLKVCREFEPLDAKLLERIEKDDAQMKIERVWFDADNIYIVLVSGHTIGNPLVWFPRLLNATPKQRQHFEIGPYKDSLHWEALDEDLILEGLFDFRRELNYAKI